jgi:hypothetical protein
LGSLFTKRKVDTIFEVDDYGVESEHKASGLIEFLHSIRLDIWKSYCNFLELWETANRQQILSLHKREFRQVPFGYFFHLQVFTLR